MDASHTPTREIAQIVGTPSLVVYKARMAKLPAVFSTFMLMACGSSNNSSIDAPLAIDAPGTGVDAKVFLDAPPDAPPVYDFSCVGTPAPTTATDPITISGVATEVGATGMTPATPTFTPLVGATATACKANCFMANNLANTVSTTGGAYTLTPVVTNGVALDGYVRMAKAGDRQTYVFPAYPFTKNTPNVPIVTFTTDALGQLFMSSHQDAAKGVIGLAVTDCANTPIGEDVTISIKQGGADVVGTSTLDLGTLDPAAKGTYLIFNVPAGATVVGAVYMGASTMPLASHTVVSFAAGTTATTVRPGYSP